jgi:hypothetical protein
LVALGRREEELVTIDPENLQQILVVLLGILLHIIPLPVVPVVGPDNEI